MLIKTNVQATVSNLLLFLDLIKTLKEEGWGGEQTFPDSERILTSVWHSIIPLTDL